MMTRRLGQAKWKFARQSIKFLGHVITPCGMYAMDSRFSGSSKLERNAIINWIMQFYRKFAHQHASKLSPLIELIKKETPWRFGPSELAHFELVKSSFTEIYLSHTDFMRDFYLQTDASKFGLGAELFQYSVNWERCTISFASRTLNTAERNYSITELELLSIVFACEKFRVFILDYSINVLTDHQALTFLFCCRLQNVRLNR